MRSPSPRFCRRLATALTSGALLVGTLHVQAAKDDEPEPEKKPSLVRRIFGGGDKEKKEEPKPEPAPEPKKTTKAKPKASTASKDKDDDKPSSKPKAKSKITLTPTGDGGAPAKPKSDPEKKAVAKKPAASSEKKSTAGKTTPESDKPAAKGKERDLDSEFGKTTEEGGKAKAVDINDKFKPADTNVTTTTAPETPAATDGNISLPPIDSSFEIVKYEGRDYVTAESMHRFYRFSTFKVDGNRVLLSNPTLILKADIGSQEMLMNNIKFILSYPLTTVGGKPAFSRLDLCKLIDPVLLPSHISDADPFDTVVVDAGHGGHDSGARGVYGFEKDFTLQMAVAVKAALMQRGFKVVMTRSTDEFITLGGRAEIANATPHSIFLSLHFNSSGPAASGIETFALSPQGSASTFMGQRSSDYHSFTGNHQDSANIALATAVHAMVIHRFKLVDRGIKRARWSVLTGCNRPGILFEGGFVTNGTECRLIASTTYRTAVATAIGDAIVNYRRALQPRLGQQPSAKRP